MSVGNATNVSYWLDKKKIIGIYPGKTKRKALHLISKPRTDDRELSGIWW